MIIKALYETIKSIGDTLIDVYDEFIEPEIQDVKDIIEDLDKKEEVNTETKTEENP